MHMGNLKGHRYSSLTQISKANVGTLKLAWKINLGYCATKNAACGSLEANAVVANGVQYIQDPFGAVYALDGATGARLWKWTPTYEAGFSVGSGSPKAGRRDRRGQGLRRARATASSIGLNQTDGTRPLVDGSDAVENGRQDVSSAPIYVNGMVLVGDSAGDNGGSSATMQAFTRQQRQARLVVERDPVRRAARLQDVVRELRRLHEQQHERRRLDVGVTRSSTRSSTSRSSAPATRCRGTAAARA